jgi:hypothetical protein
MRTRHAQMMHFLALAKQIPSTRLELLADVKSTLDATTANCSGISYSRQQLAKLLARLEHLRALIFEHKQGSSNTQKDINEIRVKRRPR